MYMNGNTLDALLRKVRAAAATAAYDQEGHTEARAGVGDRAALHDDACYAVLTTRTDLVELLRRVDEGVGRPQQAVVAGRRLGPGGQHLHETREQRG